MILVYASIIGILAGTGIIGETTTVLAMIAVIVSTAIGTLTQWHD